MAGKGNGGIALQELRLPAAASASVSASPDMNMSTAAPNLTREFDNLDVQEPPDAEPLSRLVGILVGQAVLQLPIWGFAMGFGVFQEFFFEEWTFQGSQSTTGVVGTTSNGVMYIAMPFLFAAFSRRWAHRRMLAALCGAVLASASFLLSSFSTDVWHIVATQGVAAALGCSLVYSPTTLSLGEWFRTRNRAFAYGVVLSSKNIVGSTVPLLFRRLLEGYGFRTTMRIWAAVTLGCAVAAILVTPTPPSTLLVASEARGDREDDNRDSGSAEEASFVWCHCRRRSRHSRHSRPMRNRSPTPWHFLHHRTFYIYVIAIILQSSGYSIPQTYLNTYAKDADHFSSASATLLLTIFNVPGIASSAFFGYVSDAKSEGEAGRQRFVRFRNRFLRLSATTVTAISAVCSALSAWLFWGLAASHGQRDMTLLVLFSLTYGFFAGGYSATWGAVINEMEHEAVRHNEPIDSGLLYGLLNGARGIGYVSGGLAGVGLVKAGQRSALPSSMAQVPIKSPYSGYNTSYGPLIIFTGLSTVFGGWGILWKWKRLHRGRGGV